MVTFDSQVGNHEFQPLGTGHSLQWQPLVAGVPGVGVWGYAEAFPGLPRRGGGLGGRGAGAAATSGGGSRR